MTGRGLLSDHFEGVVAKRLSDVEVSPSVSNQHEFNGSLPLRRLLGDDDRRSVPARFVWLGGEQEGISLDGTMSWYDARRAHPTRTEHRLYYPTNEITRKMKVGDTFFLAVCRDGSFLAVIVPTESVIHSQLIWLFGLEEQPGFGFMSREITEAGGATLDYAARYILDELGVEPDWSGDDTLDELIAPFGTEFPSTKKFSETARNSLPDIDAAGADADEVLMAWMEREEDLFRRLERRIVSERLATGFMDGPEADVDGFLKFSLSVQNRRKSRAGHALENHAEAVFSARGVRYTRGTVTESGNRPDFLFPSIENYLDKSFPAQRLTMPGAKSTLKDRWRQVLTEADRIGTKHLLTLSADVTSGQMAQTVGERIRLVIPKQVQKTYSADQRDRTIDFETFIGLVLDRQM